MDEGTNHLDLAKEREVNAALRELQITRVIIAHRPDPVLRLEVAACYATKSPDAQWW